MGETDWLEPHVAKNGSVERLGGDRILDSKVEMIDTAAKHDLAQRVISPARTIPRTTMREPVKVWQDSMGIRHAAGRGSSPASVTGSASEEAGKHSSRLVGALVTSLCDGFARQEA